MLIEIMEDSVAALAEYARIPIAFEVREVFDVTERAGGLGGFVLTKRTLDVPYVKDYDEIEAESPAHWAERFDVSNWVFLAAHSEGRRVGGAALAFYTEGIEMFEGRRNDLAVLWDIRVAPEARGRALPGGGSAGGGARLSSTQGRDAEHQRPRVRVLRAAGVRLGSVQPSRLPATSTRDSTALVQGTHTRKSCGG
jgi:hypothetical protein